MSKNYCIFDTETTGLDKPFCYNIGYVITDKNGSILLERSYVVEQIWHNLALFSTAYYSEKRPIYVAEMKARKTIMEKFGYICQQMKRDFKAFNVTTAYAYNSNFDERVFEFNCDWFKCMNPFDNVEVYDIRGYAHNFIVDNDYKAYCDKHSLYTESGNYSSTAETIYKYLFDDDFVEDHTALSDSRIEKDILFYCIDFGAEFDNHYPTKQSIKKEIVKTLEIKNGKEIVFSTEYNSIRINKDKTKITIK